MKTRAVMIIGGSGLVGTHLAMRLRDEFKVYASFFKRPSRVPGVTSVHMDVNDRERMKRIMYRVQPDVIIYAAGKFGPMMFNFGEGKDGTMDEGIHSNGVANVGMASDVIQPKFVYLSSPHVFDGKNGNYREADLALPATGFGKAMIGGENYARRNLNYNIVRVAPLYGFGNPSHFGIMDWLRVNLSAGKIIEVPEFELFSFAPMHGFSDMMAGLVSAGPRNKIIHYGGLTKLTFAAFALAFARFFKFDPNLIKSKHIIQQNVTGAKQPDYSLNSSYAIETLNTKAYELEEGFEWYATRKSHGIHLDP